jgi:RNA polymerase sigma-70 factor (ECF subfamily)
MSQIAPGNALRQNYSAQVAESAWVSDYELAQSAAIGVTSALGDLYERHNQRVYALCLRMTQNPAEAEDLTQEVFIHLFRKIGSFRGESQFSSWLHRLTVNLVLMHFRHRATSRERIPDDIEAKTSAFEKGKQTVARQAVDRIALDAALQQLPAGNRLVFELFDIEGYHHREIAVLLGCTVGTSKSQLHKARKKLRLLLKANQSPYRTVLSPA